MSTIPSVKLTLNLNDPTLNDEERDRQVQQLIGELNEIDEFHSVQQVRQEDTPAESEPSGSFIIGLLRAEMDAERANRLLSVLKDRLSGKPFALELEARGETLELKSVESEDKEKLAALIEEAQQFIAG